MCGIVALVRRRPHRELRSTIEAMTETLVHRGPDEAGTAVLEEDGVALGMRRLSILDLEGGRQPMWDETRNHCLVFNGEIYNFAALRLELSGLGHAFVSDHSDTEVLVHGFEEWGHGLFPRLNGMFALAIWDRAGQRLVLARDRAGEKPLYVASLPSGYAVASELKALFALPELDRALDPIALEQYLAFDYVVGARTMLRDVRKLRAGHYAWLDGDGYHEQSYWRPRFEAAGDDEPALLEELDAILDESVRLRMVADVPVGLLLSGGLDSTTVGYFMRRHSDRVNSYSIGFEESSWDESRFAEAAARHLGTNHHLEIFSQARLRELIPRIPELLDEPMGDQAVLPTYLLSTFARSDVKVALGGEGSDELLMGYRAYQRLKLAWELERLPAGLRGAVAGFARSLPGRVGPVRLRGVEFVRWLDASTPGRLLSHLGSFKGDARWVLSPSVREELPASVLDEPIGLLVDDDVRAPADQAIATYFGGYLQEDILVKADRASMAASLELRAPYLDPNLIDFSLRVPAGLKLKGLRRKYLLRRLMEDRLPSEIVNRPKFGFGVPISMWLRDSLAPLVREHLGRERLRAAGIFDADAVAQLVEEHLTGSADRGREVWLLFQFELWRQRWLNP